MTLLNMTPAKVEQMKKAAEEGESLSSIARRFGMSRNSVTRYVREPRRVESSTKRKIRSVIRKCPGCPMLFQVRSDGRRYCSESCRVDMIERENRLFVEEVRWIAGTDTWHNVAVRMGYKNVRSLARRLHHLGAFDLARLAELVDMPREYQRAA